MRRWLLALSFLPLFACAESAPENCLEVVLTGTQGGPPAVNGLAGAGTLVRYGSVKNQCNDLLLQFDAGRGTTGRLSELGVTPNDLDAVFLTPCPFRPYRRTHRAHAAPLALPRRSAGSDLQ